LSGEKGGVGASMRLEEEGGRGVEPLDSVAKEFSVGVLCPVLAELGVSTPWCECVLLGVDLVMVGLLPSTVIGGTVISDGVMTSCHELLDGSSTVGFLPVLLSLLLSRMLLGSPRTAGARDRPAELPPEWAEE
jgi:hypothetical protein